MPRIRLAGVGVLGGHRMTYYDEDTREYIAVCEGCSREMEFEVPFAMGNFSGCYCWECNPYD